MRQSDPSSGDSAAPRDHDEAGFPDRRISYLGLILPSTNRFLEGLWLLVIAIALLLQAIPFLVIVVMFSLAVGVPREAALTVVPIGFIALVFASCVYASKRRKRLSARPGLNRRELVARTWSRYPAPADMSAGGTPRRGSR